jgi:hypothetical protein
MHQTETEPQPLPPLQEEPSPEALAAVAEQVLAKPDSNGDGQVTRVDPRHMKQLEELWGGPLFAPDVAGASAGIVGPTEE